MPDPTTATFSGDQRRATDSEFLEQLRLPGAAGRALRRARAAGDHTAAVHAVATHYRRRAVPGWAFYMHGTPWIERGDVTVLTQADDILRGSWHCAWRPYPVARVGSSPRDVDWPRAMRHQAITVSRNTFLPPLTTAYALTGRTVYLFAAKDLLRGFVAAEPFVLADGFADDHDRHFGGPANSTLDVGARIFRWLDLMHCGALQAPGVFADTDVFWLVKQIWFYARQFRRLCGDPLRRDNHHLSDHGHTPYVLGLMFPEFADAPVLRQAGRRVIRHHLARNLFADGVYAEHCTRYQYHITFVHLHALACARVNGDKLVTPEQQARLRRWVGFMAHACCPDGELVSFGDEPGNRPVNLFEVLAAPVMTGRLARTVRALGYAATRTILRTSPAELTARYDRPKARNPHGNGLAAYYQRAAALPRARPGACLPASACYRQGGFTFFRERWSAEADYLAVSHYTESLPNSHTHWDMMSFVLHTRGRRLIGDPATSLYASPKIYKGDARARDRRGYLYGVQSHNCLTVDDDTFKPLAYLGHRCVWGEEPPRHGVGLFKTGGPIELLEIWHDANWSCRHRRFVLFLPGLGHVLADIITQPGLDLRPHEYTQTFHFEPGVRIVPETPPCNGALQAANGSSRCVILPGGEVQAAWSSERDARLQGIPYACEAKTRRGPWVARLTRHIQGPCTFATFLATREASDVRVEHLGPRQALSMFRQHDGFSVNRLWCDRRPTLLLAVNPQRKTIEVGELTTDGELAAATFDSRGRIAAWVLVRGSRLVLGGRSRHAGRCTEFRSGQT